MRNSLLPIGLLVLTIGASLWLIRGGAARGAGGPAVFPGIFELPSKAKLMTPSADLEATNTLAGAAPVGTATWRVLLLSGAENEPLTNTVLLALGEELTKRGCVVIMDPASHTVTSEPLPLGADGHLRIHTAASVLPQEGPGAITFTTTIDAMPVRVPADHPAARWFPELPVSVPTTFTITHQSTPRQASPWPQWYAAIGRSVSGELLRALALPASITDSAEVIRATAWVEPGQVESTSIYGRIPSPPQDDVVDQLVAFQHPFVRGWIGRLNPVPVSNRQGEQRSARAELIRRLERGGWTAGPAVGERLTYSKDDRASDGSIIHRSLTITGEQLVEWQERPKPVRLWEAWTDAAKAGNAAAAVQLRRHRTTAGLPEELRALVPAGSAP